MPTVSIDGGLSTAQDASTSADGSLARANDCYYKPGNPGVWKAQGRSTFNSVAEASDIKGIRALTYDAATDVIVVHVGTTYREATLATTGTFGVGVTGLTGGLTLDSIHYNNEHILLNGVDRGRVRSSTGIYSLLGMLAAIAAPTVSRDAGVGAGFGLNTGKTITYWIEERVKSGTVIVKRHASTTTQTVTLTGNATTDKPVITRPTVVNSDATHWALFGTATDGTFPTGAEISEVVIGTTTIEDTRIGTDPLLPSGDEYEVVSASIAGLTFNVAKNGQPPILATGDIFEDSVCGFDASDKSLFKFSIPDNIHIWPSINVIRFETKDEDEGLASRTVGQSTVAFLRDSVWRIQTLPRPEDSAFQTERVKTQIDGALGIVGPLACDIFSLGEGSRAAWISTAGLIITDGYDWDTVSDDLDWPATVLISSLSTAQLINNPNEYRLEMVADDTAGVRRQWFFHYHKSHMKSKPGGGLTFKVTGPMTSPATSKTRGLLNGLRRIYSGHTNGKVYLDAGQVSDASGSVIAMDVQTKDYYFAGVGGQGSLRRFYVHHQAASGQTASCSLIQRNHRADDNTRSISIPLDRREATNVELQGHADAFSFRLQNSDTVGPVSFDYIVADMPEIDRAKGK